MTAEQETEISRQSPLKGVIALMTSTSASQAIAFMMTPILSRLFAPEAFGVLALFMGFYGIAVSVATLRYDMGIVLPENDEEGAAMVALAMIITWCWTLMLLVVVALVGPQIAQWFGEPGVAPWLWLLPFYTASEAMRRTLAYWGTRREWFSSFAAIKVSQTLVGTGVNFALGLLMWFPLGGLILGQFLGALTAAAGWIGLVRSREQMYFKRVPAKRLLGVVARRYSDLARYCLQTQLLNALSLAVLPLVLTRSFGVVVAGIVLFITRLVQRPAQIITSSLWEVAHSRLPKLSREEQLELVSMNHRLVSFLLAFPLAMLVIFAAWLPVIFGERWETLPAYVLPMAVMVFCNAVSNATSYFAVFQRYRAEVVANVSLIVMRFGSVGVGALWFEPLGAVYLYTFSSALFYLGVNAYWGWTLGLWRRFTLNFVAVVSLVALLSAVVWGVLGAASIWGGLAAAFFAGICYLLVGVWWLDLRSLKSRLRGRPS